MTGKKLCMLISTAFLLTACGSGKGGGGLLGTYFVEPGNIKSQSAYQLSAAERGALETEVRKGIGFGNATYMRGKARKVATKDGHQRVELCAVMDLHRKTLFGKTPITWLVRAQYPKGRHKGMYVRVTDGRDLIDLRKDCKRAGLFPG